jgi:hypothetical protein
MKSSQEDYARTALRMPRDLHQAVHAAAKAEDRSFNGQLIALIREAISVRPAKLQEAKQ